MLMDIMGQGKYPPSEKEPKEDALWYQHDEQDDEDLDQKPPTRTADNDPTEW